MKRLLLLSVITLAILLSACSTAETPPTPAATPTPSPLPAPASTPAPAPSPEPSPVPEPAPPPAAIARDGSVVKVHYRGTLEDGTVFDSSLGREPLEFTIGAGTMIPGFENAVRGMEVGQKKTVTIPADEAYGPHFDDLVLVIGRDQLAEGLNPEVGQQLQMTNSVGETMLVFVVEVAEATIIVDANLPLAGQDLTFEIALVGVR